MMTQRLSLRYGSVCKTLLCLFLFLCFGEQGRCATESMVPAMYILGDSLVDNGNNPSSSAAHYLPYGRDFDNGMATGRFTNGRQVTDYLARYLKLGAYPVPAAAGNMSVVAHPGLNLAVAGTGLRLETALVNNVEGSLGTQVDYFLNTALPALRLILRRSGDSIARHMGKSIFFIWMGSNDWAQVRELLPRSGGGMLSVEVLDNIARNNTEDLLGLLREQILRLYDVGARRFIIPQLYAIGCSPMVSRGNTCYEPVNRAVQIYNGALSRMLKADFYGADKRLSGAQVLHPSFFRVSRQLALNPEDHGLQGKGPCLGPRGVCANADDYMFWDYVHPSQQFYKIMAHIVWKAKHGKKTWLTNNCQEFLKKKISWT